MQYVSAEARRRVTLIFSIAPALNMPDLFVTLGHSVVYILFLRLRDRVFLEFFFLSAHARAFPRLAITAPFAWT